MQQLYVLSVNLEMRFWMNYLQQLCKRYSCRHFTETGEKENILFTWVEWIKDAEELRPPRKLQPEPTGRSIDLGKMDVKEPKKPSLAGLKTSVKSQAEQEAMYLSTDSLQQDCWRHAKVFASWIAHQRNHTLRASCLFPRSVNRSSTSC